MTDELGKTATESIINNKIRLLREEFLEDLNILLTRIDKAEQDIKEIKIGITDKNGNSIFSN